MRADRTSVLIVLLLGACGPTGDDGSEPTTDPEPTWLDLREPDEELPATLGEVGLYPEMSRLDEVSPAALPYEPTWALWSNGLVKSRYLALPEGEVISTGEDGWTFPDGALLFKTFEDDDGPVETRVMWKSPADGWQWSVYVWNEDGDDAERTEGRKSVDVDVTVGGEEFSHKVPNELDCRKCHEPDPNGVLGFEPLQLGDATGELSVFDDAPAQEFVDHEDDTTREILGWFLGNCTSCHNGLSNHDQSSFDLRPDAALNTIIDVETESSASVDGVRVVPGSPAESVLFLAVSGESDDPELKLMPPVGVQRRDHAAIERLRTWIEGLE